MSTAAEIEITPAAQKTLGTLVSALAHDKAAMGRRYGEWAVSAPTLESGVAAAAMAQDELGHARSTFPLLKQLGFDASDDDRLETNSTVALLNEPLPNWETFIAVNLVVDGMLTAFVEASRDSAFEPLAQRARKILQEERSHTAHATAWARRLANSNSGRDLLLDALTACRVQVEEWPGDEAGYAELVAGGLVAGSPGELRAANYVRIANAFSGTELDQLWQ